MRDINLNKIENKNSASLGNIIILRIDLLKKFHFRQFKLHKIHFLW